jgi:hypothetical protein
MNMTLIPYQIAQKRNGVPPYMWCEITRSSKFYRIRSQIGGQRSALGIDCDLGTEDR